jgi:hypothetical protein
LSLRRLLFMSRYPIWGGMLAWQSVTSFGIPAWNAFLVILRCDDVLNRASATTQWQTFDAFLADPLRPYGLLVTLILAIVIFAASLFMERGRQLAATDLTPRQAPL